MLDKRFFCAQALSCSPSSPFGHSGLLRGCEAIVRRSRMAQEQKARGRGNFDADVKSAAFLMRLFDAASRTLVFNPAPSSVGLATMLDHCSSLCMQRRSAA